MRSHEHVEQVEFAGGFGPPWHHGDIKVAFIAPREDSRVRSDILPSEGIDCGIFWDGEHPPRLAAGEMFRAQRALGCLHAER